MDHVLVTIGGSVADLDRLSGAALVMDLDVTGLKAGTHEVTPTANLAGRDHASWPSARRPSA